MRYSSLSGLAATVPRRVNGRSIAIGALMLALVALTAACGSSGGDPTQASAVESTVALPQNHGLVVAGYTLRRAVDMTKIIEQTAMQILGCLAAGKEPPVLPDDIVEVMREAGDLIG